MRSRRKSQPPQRLALPRPVKPRDHAAIATLDDACGYMLALPRDIAERQAWQKAAELALSARNSPRPHALAAFTRQLELALFTTYRLDLAADALARDAQKKSPARGRRPGSSLEGSTRRA